MCNDFHRDYVAESIKRYETSQFYENPSFLWLQSIAAKSARVADHARSIAIAAGDSHGAAVAETVRSMAYHTEKKISMKQGFVIARILTERYGTARAVAAALYALSDDEIDNAHV